MNSRGMKFVVVEWKVVLLLVDMRLIVIVYNF